MTTPTIIGYLIAPIIAAKVLSLPFALLPRVVHQAAQALLLVAGYVLLAWGLLP
jgi:hypothetical protein